MSTKMYNKTNFHNRTFCIFTEVAFDNIKNLEVNFKSKSGSCYYFTKNGVYRYSNHWSRVANCKWRLIANHDSKNTIETNAKQPNKLKLGFANWSDFYPDNDIERLYFIEVDFTSNIVNFYHKCSPNFLNECVLRTSSETTKLIKQIRSLLQETAWSKYFDEYEIDDLREQIINQLITTNKSFNEIRKQFITIQQINKLSF